MTAAEALGCQACGLPITPCLICASPLPVPGEDDSPFKTCRNCGVVNPLGDKYREVLDIPPTLALPSAMVRRAQIARVGRRPYVLAKHVCFMHLSADGKKKGEGKQDGGPESHGLTILEISARLLRKGSPVPEIFASTEEGHPFTFLPYMQDTLGANVVQEAACGSRKAVDRKRLYPFSDSESPVKRMRLSPREEVIDQVEKGLSGHQAQVPPSNGGCAAVVSNARTSSMAAPLNRDPANAGEPTGKLQAGSGITAEPPFKTNCTINARSNLGEPDDVEVISADDGGKTSIPSNEQMEVLHCVVQHEASVANKHDASRIDPCLQSYRFAIDELESFKEVSKDPFLERTPLNVEDAQHHEGGEARNSIGSVDQRLKRLEHSELIKHPSSSVQKADDNGDLGAFEPENRDVTGSEEVPTRRQERECSECGQAVDGSGSFSRNVDDTELMRCCTQILELYCPHTLKSDMRTPCAYPLCCPIPRYPLPAGSTSSSKQCRSYVTQFTVDALRTAHSTLISSTQESTSEEVASPLRGVEQALSMADRFMEIRARMDHVQALIQQVDGASAQASRDFKAYGDRGAFSLASQLIPRLLNREKQQNVERGKNDVQVMTMFLQDVNKLLTTCFQYVGKILEASSCLMGDNHAGSNAVNLNVFSEDIENKPGLEAVRTAIPLWLRMYHDVAHSSGILK